MGKMFVLRPQLEVDVLKLAMHLDLVDEPYVGVHIRRGDKIAESGFFRKTEDFAREAERLCAAVGARKIFLASDDASEFEKLRSHIRNRSITVLQQPRLSPETYHERGALQHTAESVLINDMILVVRADAYVRTASSN